MEILENSKYRRKDKKTHYENNLSSSFEPKPISLILKKKAVYINTVFLAKSRVVFT